MMMMLSIKPEVEQDRAKTIDNKYGKFREVCSRGF